MKLVQHANKVVGKKIKPIVYQKTISSITKEKTKTDEHFRIAQLGVLDPQYYLPLEGEGEGEGKESNQWAHG